MSVFGDRALFENMRQLLDGRQVKGKPLVVTFSEQIVQATNADMVVFSEQQNNLLRQHAIALRRTETLLVTSNSAEKQDVMINFVVNPTGNSLSFEVNKSNIIFEGLEISDELLMLGGSELDVAVLYRETQNAMQRIKSESEQLERQSLELQSRLEQSSVQLAESSSKLAANNQLLAEREQALEELQSKIDQQQQLFAQKEQEFAQREAEFSRLTEQKNEEVKASQQVLLEQQAEIIEKATEISRMEQTI